MMGDRHPRAASATPNAPELLAEPTSAPSLSITSPKESRPTPVLTQASNVRSLAKCSRTSASRSGGFLEAEALASSLELKLLLLHSKLLEVSVNSHICLHPQNGLLKNPSFPPWLPLALRKCL